MTDKKVYKKRTTMKFQKIKKNLKTCSLTYLLITMSSTTSEKSLNKHFPPPHNLRKILNINKIKITYNCMPNMKAITRITGHNKKLLKKKNSPQSKYPN